MHPTLGTEESIKTLTRDDMVNFRAKHYHKENMIWVVMGNVSPKQGEVALEMALKGKEIPDTGPMRNGSYKPNLEEHRFEHTSEQAIIGLWYPWMDEKESKEIDYADMIFMNALGQGMHSLLFDRIREKKGMAYATGSYNYNYPSLDLLWLFAMTSSDKVEECFSEMRQVLTEVAEDGYDDELFGIAKSNTLFGIADSWQKIENMAYNTVDDWFDNKDLYPGEFADSKLVSEKMENVTNDDMKAIAQSLCDSDFKTVVMNG